MTFFTPAQPRVALDPPEADNRGALGGLPASDAGLSLGTLLGVVSRWRWLIALVTVALVLPVLALLFAQTPQYEATSTVLIDSRRLTVADLESVLSDLAQEEEAAVSEVEVVRSALIAQRVIDRLGLMDTAEINPLLSPPAPGPDADPEVLYRHWVGSRLAALKALLSGGADRGPLPPALVQAKALERFAGRLTAARVGRSRAISITYRSDDPVRAARVANAVVEVYLALQTEMKRDATERATDWLDGQIEQLRVDVERKERQIEELRAGAGLVLGDRATLARQQMSDLDAQLTRARAQLADAQARFAEVTRVIRAPTLLESTPEVMASPSIQALRRQEAEALQRAAERSTVFGERHPEFIKVRAEIADLRDQILAEVAKIAEQIRREVGVNTTLVASLEDQLDALKDNSRDLGQAEVALRALEREAEANRTLLQTFLERARTTGEQVTLVQPDARILSPAEIPAGPASPQKKLVLAMAIAFALCSGLVLALVLDQMDDTVRSSDQLAALAGLDTLALLPRRQRRLTGGDAKADALWDEGLKSLFDGLVSRWRQSPRVVLFTSAVPDEGKTSTATALARFAASMGMQVVLVDGDLRNPGVHTALGLPNQMGLSDHLSGAVEIANILHADPATGLHVIPAGAPVRNTLPLLRSDRMRTLLDLLAAEYELVVLDAPPVLMMADARCLAEHAEATVFVVRWSHARRNLIASAVRQLRASGALLAGAVLNRIDMDRHARYGFSDSTDLRQYRRYYGRSA